MTRDEFGHHAASMTAELSIDLQSLMLRAYDALTDDERSKLTDEDKPLLIVRAIAMAVGQRAVSEQFDVAAIERLTPRVKRILSRRREW